MAKNTFDSWQEAYLYQLNSRLDDDDHLYMHKFYLQTGVEAIDNLVATSGKDIVWVVVVEDDCEVFTQYGVGKLNSWFSVQFEGYGKPLEEVEGSLREYSCLSTLIENDNKAIVICENMVTILEVYNFFYTDKVYPTDLADENYISNKVGTLEFAKNMLEKYGSSVKEDDLEEDCCEDCCCDGFCEGYYDEDDLIDDDDLDIEDYFFCYESEDDDDLKDEDYCGYDCDDCCNNCFDNCFDIEDDSELKLLTEDNDDNDCGIFIVRFGDKNDELDEEEFELTEDDAVDVYNETIGEGWKFVELLQLKRVHAILD